MIPYASFHVPQLPLQAILRMDPDLRRGPVAVMREAGRQSRVGYRNQAAAEHGVVVGMTASQALARCPEIATREVSPERERLAARLLLSAAWTLAPRVEETGSGLVTIDLDGAPPESLQERMDAALDRLLGAGLEASAGVAETPVLAILAARAAAAGEAVSTSQRTLTVTDSEAFLRRLPLAAIEPPQKLAELLAQWGIETAGAFLALPREEVAARLGTEALDLWEETAGHRPRILRPTVLPPRFRESSELESSIDQLEPLLFLLRRFLDTLCAQLDAAFQVATDMVLELTLDQRPPYRRTLALPVPTGDPETLFRTLQAHLEQVRTEAAITGLALELTAQPPQRRQRGLFDTSLRNPWKLADTLDRLAGLVGSDRVGSPRPADSFRPDAIHSEALPDELPPPDKPGPVPPGGPALRRLRPPLSALVELSDGRPTALSCPLGKGSLQGIRGPWKLSGDWWREESWLRREWDVALESGHLLRLVESEGRWFVEGVYD